MPKPMSFSRCRRRVRARVRERGIPRGLQNWRKPDDQTSEQRERDRKGQHPTVRTNDEILWEPSSGYQREQRRRIEPCDRHADRSAGE